MSRSASIRGDWQSFSKEAQEFLQKTEKYVQQGVNPGGYYHAIWCRDASYILKDWFLSGVVDDVMQEVLNIWSHQITPGKEKIVYGRGSPEMKYLSQVANSDFKKTFEGALPTSIFKGHSEVFGKNPDIDSTALMISTTSWIFDAYLGAGLLSRNSNFYPRVKGRSDASRRLPASSPSEIIDSTVPQMLKAVEYLLSRDVDNDGLLEQDHNEDWMDSVLRAGKIVYTQACWIMALTNLSLLLSHINMNKEASKMRDLADKTVLAVENQLWSEEEHCYLDKQESHHLGESYKTLTQDVSLYLVATTEKTARDMLGSQVLGSNERSDKGQPTRRATVNEKTLSSRAASTRNAIRNRIWKDKWPLCSETELKISGPWNLNPNVYHNHTFWPWTTGLEMLARSRYERYDEGAALLSYLTGNDKNGDFLAYCEWVNPITGKRGGAFPFRTGISSIRIALTDILGQMERKTKSTDINAEA